MGLFDNAGRAIGSLAGASVGAMVGGPWGAVAGWGAGGNLGAGKDIWGDDINSGNGATAPRAPTTLPNGQPIPNGGYGGSQFGGSTTMNPARQTDQYGMPLVPGYQSNRDANGELLSPYKVSPKQMAGSGTWAQLANAKNDEMTKGMIDAANQKGLAATQDSMNELMMNGGLASGARERVASDGAKNALFASQDARKQGDLNSLDIALQAENMNRDTEKFNIGNDLNAQTHNSTMASQDLANYNTSNQFGYEQQMKDWTGRYVADATAAAYAKEKPGIWDRITGALGF